MVDGGNNMATKDIDVDWPDLSGAVYNVSDEEVLDRIREAAEEHDTAVEKIIENVQFILDAEGDGVATTAEGVSESTAVNPDNESDSRLEALRIWEMRQDL
jgi:predicted  nucleic acid-binding Zn-ribbon protein